MADKDDGFKLPLLGLPLPISLAFVVAILSLLGLSIPGSSKPANVQLPAISDFLESKSGDRTEHPVMEILKEAFGANEELRDNKSADATGRTNDSKVDLKENTDSKERKPVASKVSEYVKQLNSLPSELRNNLTCVIATLPDPNDSHFQLAFDIGLESMVRAFQAHGYVRDRYKLLWQNDLRAIRAKNEDFDVRRARSYASPILFRGKDSKHALLLLVGETPNAGVHRDALHDALNIIEAVSRSKDKTRIAKDKDDFLIVGPCYSGSSEGLRCAILDWKVPPRATISTDAKSSTDAGTRDSTRKLRIISGIATSASNQSILETPKSNSKCSCSPDQSQHQITYSAAIASDNVVLQGIIKHFTEDRGVPVNKIALLSETDTSYGAELLSTKTSTTDAVHNNNSTNDLKSDRSVDLGGILTLTYPMMLSRMRSEYGHHFAKPENVQTQADALKRRNLDLSEELSPFATDVLPNFSSSSVAVADRVLERLLDTIREEEIKVVGILGTDVSDKLFIAQRMRELAPNVQLFTLEADLLFSHSDYSKLFRGMIVGSSYPLFPPTQRWYHLPEQPGRGDQVQRTIQFSSDMAQGIYNATVALLNDSPGDPCRERKKLLDYGRLFEISPQQFSSLSAIPPPSGWLSVVGETRLWPLQQIGMDGFDRLPKSTEVHKFESPPRFLMTAVLCAVSLLLVFYYVFWNSDSRKDKQDRVATDPDASAKSYGGFEEMIEKASAGMRWLRLPLHYSSPKAESKNQPNINSRDQTLFFDRAIYVGTFFTALTVIVFGLSLPNLIYCWDYLLTATVGFDRVAKNETLGSSVFLRQLVSMLLIFPTIAATSITALHSATCAFRYNILDSTSEAYVGHNGRVQRIRTLDQAFRVFLLAITSAWLIATIAACTLLLLKRCIYGDEIGFNVTPRVALLMLRSSNYSDLVNPALPIVFLSGMLMIWALCNLKRLKLTADYGLTNPFKRPNAEDSNNKQTGYIETILSRIELAYRKILADMEGIVSFGLRTNDIIAIVGFSFFLSVLLCRDWIATCEGKYYDLLFHILFFVAVIVMLGLLLRARNLLRSTDELLRLINRLPLAEQFSKIPKEIRDKTSDLLYASRPKVDDYSLLIRKLDSLRQRQPRRLFRGPDVFALEFQEHFKDTYIEIDEAIKKSRSPEEDLHLGVKLADFTSDHLVPGLVQHWEELNVRSDIKRSGKGEQGNASVEADKARGIGASISNHEIGWWKDIEEVVAVQIAHQIRVVFIFSRTFLSGIIAMFFFLLWAVNSYPFQPASLLNLFCFIMMIWILISVFNAILRFNRNPILSKINGTEPNRLTFDSSFWVPMISYVGLPILAVLATLLPTVGRSLFSWTAIFSQMLVSGG